ncbi:hypothetical protein BCR34DRAFT_121446 [Clohesyomyces aquaticus]|uniref:Probable double zinc ribbon domain-containing protein n=1 Tax=Clohesyomyces aquaticus TaxID=1231657 RepID=A0A1Y2A1B5_9PLEO|nr:hypothetical protein BCR34DRAFT_121446 [Clohesyomyces aquaticus]
MPSPLCKNIELCGSSLCKVASITCHQSKLFSQRRQLTRISATTEMSANQSTSKPPTTGTKDSWKWNYCSREHHPRSYHPHSWDWIDPDEMLMRGEGHGKWKCCKCYLEYLLTLHFGLNPFHKLKCCCGHVMCYECSSTGVLRRAKYEEDPVTVWSVDGEIDWNEIGLGGVCPACGISWRYREHVARQKKKSEENRRPFMLRRLTPSKSLTNKPGLLLRVTDNLENLLPESMKKQRITELSRSLDSSKRLSFGTKQAELICLYCGETNKMRWFRFKIGDPSEIHAKIQEHIPQQEGQNKNKDVAPLILAGNPAQTNVAALERMPQPKQQVESQS